MVEPRFIYAFSIGCI